MSTVIVTGHKAEFNGPYISVLVTGAPLYRQAFEVARVTELPELVANAKTSIGNQDAAIWLRVSQGRKPAGFDKWVSSTKGLYTQKAVETVQS